MHSSEDDWAALAETLRAAVKEHPKKAAEVCAQKLQQLQLGASPSVEARARQLLESLWEP